MQRVLRLLRFHFVSVAFSLLILIDVVCGVGRSRLKCMNALHIHISTLRIVHNDRLHATINSNDNLFKRLGNALYF